MLADLEEYAARARMMASPIRFGEWLMENFGRELVRQRRARTLVLAALSRGPAAVIEPIREGRDVEDDVTPTSFPVVLRADTIEERGAIEPSPPPSSYMPSEMDEGAAVGALDGSAAGERRRAALRLRDRDRSGGVRGALVHVGVVAPDDRTRASRPPRRTRTAVAGRKSDPGMRPAPNPIWRMFSHALIVTFRRRSRWTRGDPSGHTLSELATPVFRAGSAP